MHARDRTGYGARKGEGFFMKVLLADGHPTTRLGIKSLLLMTDARVVGEAGDGREALRLVEETMPDLVILGLNLTGEVDGVEACRRMKDLPKPPRVLVHAAYNLSGYVSVGLLGEADGYLHKRAYPQKLLDAIHRTAAGERVWLSGDAHGESRFRMHTTPGESDLTQKEREVLALMLRRCTNAEIARKLYLSLPTVKTHVRNILRKTGAKNRKDLFQTHAPETSVA